MSLTRRALLLVSLIIFLAIIGIWFAEPLQGLWRWPAVFLLLLMGLERIHTENLFTIQREIAPRLFLGEPIKYHQIVTNLGRHPLCLESQPDYPDELVADRKIQSWSILPGKSQTQTFTVLPVILGEAKLGKNYIRTLGRFGLVWWRHKVDDAVTFNTEPAMLQHHIALTGKAQSGSRNSRRQIGSGFELLNLRDYQYGDPQHSIDWKASARRQKPMVRVFTKEQRLEMAILIDCGRSSFIRCGLMDRLHHYVNIAARLAEFAIQHHDHMACVAYVDGIIDHVPMAGGAEILRNIRQLLGKLTAISEESNLLETALELKQYLKRRSLVILLTEIEQAESASQLIKAVQLLRGKHHVVVASIDDPEINSYVHDSSQRWLAPYQNFAALEYCRGRQLTCERLKQSGVAVLTASPEKLDRVVLSFYQRIRERRDV